MQCTSMLGSILGKIFNDLRIASAASALGDRISREFRRLSVSTSEYSNTG